MKEILLNKLPSPTWSWLKMNNAKLSLDSDLNLENFLPETRGIENGIEYKENASSLKKEIPDLTDALEEFPNLFNEEKPIEIRIRENNKIEKPVVLTYDFSDNQKALTTQVIKTEENSEITVIIFSKSDKNAAGLQLLKTELYAAPYSKINLVKIQTLGKNFTQIDNTICHEEDSSQINVSHIILGSDKTYLALSSNLKGYKADFKSDTGYYCEKGQELDMNFLVNHFGKKTNSLMNVYGSLNEKAKKTYRGTIDLKKGAKDACGEEYEDVLLLSENAINNSIPVILCTEEDVQGEHGATIGRISDEELFYMSSRGIGKDECEKLISRSKVQRVLDQVKDEEILNKTNKFMDELFGVN